MCWLPRVEGADRKSFFAVAESANGIDNFKFWDYPVLCLRQVNRKPIYMTCVWFSMKMDGFMEFSAQNTGTKQRLKAISQRQSPNVALPVQRIW